MNRLNKPGDLLSRSHYRSSKRSFRKINFTGIIGWIELREIEDPKPRVQLQ